VFYTHNHGDFPNEFRSVSAFTDDTVSGLAGQINVLLRDRTDLTIASAESCSGGSIAQAITAFPGSSNYFMGGIVSYVNRAKAELLGVPEMVLETRGAVSPECAEAMAEGARAAFHSDIAISTTGIAGPTGATARKPVGLVYTAIATAGATMVNEHYFDGDRAAVTEAATLAALRLILNELERTTRLADSTTTEN
jgi:PncC family amidohydrolase